MDGRLLFRKRHRLTHSRQFRAVYEARVSKAAGPLVVYLLPNDAPCPRLGLSVGRRVGPAARRNQVKRRLRESFRILQHTLPTLDARPYDLVINVRPHNPLSQAEYQRHLAAAAHGAHQVWARRAQRATIDRERPP